MLIKCIASLKYKWYHRSIKVDVGYFVFLRGQLCGVGVFCMKHPYSASKNRDKGARSVLT